MRVVILVPFRPDGGRRDALWRFTRGWLEDHHPEWEIFVGESPEGPFNRGAAINDAATKAWDWDVAVITDADNICDPHMLRKAVKKAWQNNDTVFPFQVYMYLDQYSSDRLIIEGNMFVAPQMDKQWGVICRHGSGIEAMSRKAYDQIGGFLELEGWGGEDCAKNTLLTVFTEGTRHLEGTALHLWHERAGDTAKDDLPKRPAELLYGPQNRNRLILADIMSMAVLPEKLRGWLQAGGHPIPDKVYE